MDERFDGLTRVLATPMPRRRALMVIVGAVGGSVLGLRPTSAGAQARCHNVREPCDRPDMCCPGLRCNLSKSECEY